MGAGRARLLPSRSASATRRVRERTPLLATA